MKSMLEIMAEVNAEVRSAKFIRAVTGGVKDAPDSDGIVIRRVMVPEWTCLEQAAKVLKRTSTQIRRHVSGEQPSAKLARDMDRLGIHVEAAL